MKESAVLSRFCFSAVVLFFSALPLSAQVETLQGSGATFPAPLYMRWAFDFQQANSDSREVLYQAVGSGGGVRDFINALTDFGASDVAMTDDEIAKVGGDVLFIPMTAGPIVISYNVPGVSSGLKLSRKVYVGIFLGTIKTWDDPQIIKDNPDQKLPSLPIKVVTRADGSGTTAAFTGHLCTVSDEFKTNVGSGKSVTWPVGVAATGNDGITEVLQKTPGAVGYVEFGYALLNNLSIADLQNKSGHFITPTIESASATLSKLTLPDNYRAFIYDPEGDGDYPIATFTWLLIKKHYDSSAKLSLLKAFINYAITTGQSIAPQMGYIPLPDPLVSRIQDTLEHLE